MREVRALQQHYENNSTDEIRKTTTQVLRSHMCPSNQQVIHEPKNYNAKQTLKTINKYNHQCRYKDDAKNQDMQHPCKNSKEFN